MAVPTQEFAQVSAPAAGKRGKHEPQGELADAYLVAQAKRGDSVAYDRIVRRYRGFVRLKASSYFLLGGESDDLIQEGLVGLYKAVRDFRSRSRVELPQLRGALHHAADDHRGEDREPQQARAAQPVDLVRELAGRGRRRRVDARGDPARARSSMIRPAR